MPKIELFKELPAEGKSFEINIDLNFKESQIVAFYGESGAGKTSILRMISGLMKPDRGKIEYAGNIWFNSVKKINSNIQSREVAMVFQGTSLFPNMTVSKNLEYAAQGKFSLSFINDIAKDFRINEFLYRNAKNLSGGQKQRVELARSILRKPKLLLLDEPFNALDHNLKNSLRSRMLQLIHEMGITTILVSHDVGDVISMADYVYEIKEGSIINKGTPLDLFTDEPSFSNFHITGEVIDIKFDNILSIVAILIGKQIVKIAAHPSEVSDVAVGDLVSINSKAFNPIIQKIK